MKIAITGASGFLGSALSVSLASAGHTIVPLPRPWNLELLDNTEALIHLAGADISARLWTKRRKRVIFDSRVRGTTLFADYLGHISQPPKIFICASGLGYYGSRGDEWLDESAPAGEGFLAEVCKAWEGAARSASENGVRVVHLRFGLVMGPEGGALKKMTLPFRLGLGGRIGNGRQFMSWISLEDALGAIQVILNDSTLTGPMNISSASPVTNLEFTRTLAQALHRPALIPFPAFAVEMIFGQMGRETLLASQRLKPQKLLNAGFRFRHPTLGDALKGALN